MNWEQLLSLKRFGDENKRVRAKQDETRLGFDVDYDRVIFSSAFRSLQDKTQVIPLSETDFVHTRLTHSLEVSVVGRSLGRRVGKLVLEKNPNLVDLGYHFNDFGAIVAAAALAHDIGNPPFGHAGERAIGEYFKSGNGLKFKSELTDKEYQDLIDFEGNANGFKILTQSRQGVQGGLRLSYATLGAFIKYPKESLPKKPTKHISDKKYGFFQSDKKAFLEVVSELGMMSKDRADLSYFRHPLAYLVEAADDICYTIIDFEDGVSLGLVDEEKAIKLLKQLVGKALNETTYNKLVLSKDKMSYLRALAIGVLVDEVVTLFLKNESLILKGDFASGLLDVSSKQNEIEAIINLSVSNVYTCKDVVEKEVMGYKVLDCLLDVFITALYNSYQNNASSYDKLVLQLLPKEFLQNNDDSLYFMLMQICSYVSGLSDSFALRLHKKVSGVFL